MITVEVRDNIQIIRVESAVIDQKMAAAVRQTVMDRVPQYQMFVLELSKTNLVDSGGLAGLIMLQKFMNQQTGKLHLAGLSKTVKSVFQMTRMDKVFKVYPTLEDSITELEGS